ncbi:MAG: FHA domain-containing protein, partial [Planctomycetes bacterium]|nr:FHA domain-containing protein [Planctomycetota bacterium]
MFYLKITGPSGDVKRIKLSKSQPLSIGRHPSADVRIDEEGVHRLHARISWRDNTYEIVAATSDGIEVNGTRVRKWKLSTQDIVRIGQTELRLRYKKTVAPEKKPKVAESPPASAQRRPEPADATEAPPKPAEPRQDEKDEATAKPEVEQRLEFVLASDEDIPLADEPEVPREAQADAEAEDWEDDSAPPPSIIGVEPAPEPKPKRKPKPRREKPPELAFEEEPEELLLEEDEEEDYEEPGAEEDYEEELPQPPA